VLCTFTYYRMMHTYLACSYDKGMSLAISSRGILTPCFRLNMYYEIHMPRGGVSIGIGGYRGFGGVWVRVRVRRFTGLNASINLTL
jgi:hypothetical protein